MNLLYKVVFLNIISMLFLLNIPTQAISATSYLLGPDDVINVFVWGHPELSGEKKVTATGSIPFLLIGDVMVEGLTKEELETILTEKLSRYIIEPQVSVTITQYNSKKVYILGEVNRPGEYPMGGSVISLREAILKAGLPTKSAALRRVRIITPQATKPIIKIVDLYTILHRGHLQKDITLQPGDIVYVPSNIPTKISNILEKITAPITKIFVFLGMVRRI